MTDAYGPSDAQRQDQIRAAHLETITTTAGREKETPIVENCRRGLIACARLEILERVTEERWTRLDVTLRRLEGALERIDRRMWLAASACAAAGTSAAAALIWRLLG